MIRGQEFKISDLPAVHKINVINCGSCAEGYPKNCECGGFVHGGACDDDKVNPLIVSTCDRCGMNWKIVEKQRPHPVSSPRSSETIHPSQEGNCGGATSQLTFTKLDSSQQVSEAITDVILQEIPEDVNW